MKKYTLFAMLMASFVFTQDLMAQNARRSDAERMAIHNNEKTNQQSAAVNTEMQRMIFRFETAYEDKDVESTKVLQETLVNLMRSAIDYRAKNGEQMATTTKKMVDNFAKYAFKFNGAESKKAVEMKGVPNEFMKLMK